MRCTFGWILWVLCGNTLQRSLCLPTAHCHDVTGHQGYLSTLYLVRDLRILAYVGTCFAPPGHNAGLTGLVVQTGRRAAAWTGSQDSFQPSHSFLQ
jgi:hypothetical protein